MHDSNKPRLLPAASEAGSTSSRPFSAQLEAGAAALLVALLAGFHVTGLLYFLNPHLALSFAGFTFGAGRFGLLLVPLAWLVHLLGTRLRNARVRRLLPWSLTGVLGAAALANWVHASHYSFYLPPAINANMIRTALWLTLGAVLAFYTALLHSVHHRRYGPKSLALLMAVVVGSLYVVVARRAAYQPSVARPTVFAEPATRQAPRLLVVGIEGGTLDLLLPLARQGRLPFLAGMLDEGSYARLTSFSPVRRLGLWGSLFSGKLPFRHALAGPTRLVASWLGPGAELRLLPLGFSAMKLDRLLGEHRLVTRRDRQTLTLWEIFGRLGRTSALIGAPEPLLSTSGDFAAASDALFRGAPGAPVAAPEAFAGRLELLRGEASAASPSGLSESPESAPATLLPEAIERTLDFARGQDRWRAALAGSLLADGEAPAALFVDLPGLLDVELLTLGGFHAAELSGSRAGADRRAAEALTDYMAFLDGTLADLWERMPEPRILAVVSAYGVEPPTGLRRLAAEVWKSRRTTGTVVNAPDGALLLRGEGVRRGATLATARIIDLVPTLLYASRLPIARDFDGRVLTEAFEPSLLQSLPLTFLPTYEDLYPRTPG